MRFSNAYKLIKKMKFKYKSKLTLQTPKLRMLEYFIAVVPQLSSQWLTKLLIVVMTALLEYLYECMFY